MKQRMTIIAGVLCACVASVNAVEVEITAGEYNIYDTDEVATFYSAVLTNELATFQIAFKVTPEVDRNIEYTSNGWGLTGGNIYAATYDYVYVDTLQITNFNANGGSMTTNRLADLSFESLHIFNGHNAQDRVLAVVNGVTNDVGGVQLTSADEVFDLAAIVDGASATNFSLSNGSAASSKDKYSCGDVTVSYTVKDPTGIKLYFTTKTID
jgi:hypothetical protein